MSLFSVYSKGYKSNLPNRDAPWYDAYPYMTSRLPQTTFPWDAANDEQYQADITNPYYRWYGNMNYPHWVQRQRLPLVYAQDYINPKASEYTRGNHTYQIPQYPPQVYWYPNPVTCEDACGADQCNEYYRRLNDYRMCKVCQNLKKPMCWDPNRQRCVDCHPEHALESCTDRFGCRNPNGWLQSRVPPINPKYSGCKQCK